MAEAARRLDRECGSDAVHRLLARPIRLEYSRQCPPPEHAAEAMTDEGDRLRAELDLLKAILRAERSEVAHLKARLSIASQGSEAGPDVAAMRDRWADLFDRLFLERR